MKIATIAIDSKSLILEPTPVNLKRTKENIADEYGNIPDGLQKEAIQNAWDARIDKKGAEEWKIEITYDPNNNNLRIEDFGTTGIIKWDYFHSLWFSDKDAKKELGSRGQGKALLHACGEFIIAETQVNGKYLCRYSTPEGYIDFEGQKERELFHDGTLISIYNVPSELREELKDIDFMVRCIQLTWWEIIGEFDANIIYRAGKKKVKVPPLKLPSYSPKSHSRVKDSIVKKGKTTHGIISKLSLFYADADIPEDIRGIAVNVRGQTIKRWKPPLLGIHSKRLFGSCSADFLAKAETPNHSNFKARDPSWKATKSVLEVKVTDFLEPVLQKDTTVDSKYQRIAKDVLKEINKTLEFFPDLDPVGAQEAKKRDSKIKKVRTNVYIKSLSVNKREYLRGEEAQITVHTHNPLPVPKENYHIEVIIRDPNNTEIFTTGQPVNYISKDGKLHKYQYNIEPEALKGSYIACATIFDSTNSPIDSRIKLFEVEPEIQPDEEKKEKPPDKGEGRRKARGLRLIKVIRQKDPSKPGPESHYDTDNNILLMNISHPTAKYLIQKNAKGLKYHVVKCATNELIKNKYKKIISGMEEEDISVAEIEKMLNELFMLKQQFFAKWGQLFSKM